MAKQTYQLLARLADRGMGETYLARTGEGGGARLVAIERLPRARAGDAEVVRTFLESARAGALLSHANVVQILDAGRLGSSYFVATELVDGELLRSIIQHARAQGRLQVPLRAVLTIAAGIATALHFAHERKSGDGEPGIVHGNLTPSNVIISRDGIVKLLDFGVPAGGPLGYRSPEQLRGDAVDARSDLFSLGVVLWELLTREPLFDRATDAATREAIEHDVAPPPSLTRMDVPQELDAILGKLLAKLPADRYRDADDLLVDIEALATKLGFPISTTDLARVMRVWFGATPNLAGLEAQGTVESNELSAEPVGDDADRVLEQVPGLSVAMFELEGEEERRAANPTPPPVEVGTPVESFTEIRDRILGARNKPDSQGPNPRSQAYTQLPKPASEGRTTLQGISPTAISDVISRVTQAAAAAGAATRDAIAAPREADATPEPSVADGAANAVDDIDEPPAPVEAPPMVAAVAAVAETPHINGVARTTGLLAAQAMAEAAERAEAASKAQAAEQTDAASNTGLVEKAVAAGAAEAAAKSERPRDSNELAASVDAAGGKPEHRRSKEEPQQIAQARTQSAEWFDRGEREAKEAHAAHARAIAKGRHPHDHPGTPDAAAGKRAHGVLYPVLGFAAAALVVIALVKIATREPASKVARHDARAVALAPTDAELVQGSVQDPGSAVAMGTMVAGASVDAAIPTSVDAAIVAAAPDAAVIAPAADAAVRVAMVADAGAAKTEHTKAAHTKAEHAQTAHAQTARAQTAHAQTAHATAAAHTRTRHAATATSKNPEQAATIEQMFDKGEYAKANQACATNTRFNPARLEVCALAACNVKDTALATRWLRAIDHAAREDVAAKCKAAGLELTVP